MVEVSHGPGQPSSPSVKTGVDEKHGERHVGKRSYAMFFAFLLRLVLSPLKQHSRVRLKRLRISNRVRFAAHGWPNGTRKVGQNCGCRLELWGQSLDLTNQRLKHFRGRQGGAMFTYMYYSTVFIMPDLTSDAC